jgi:mannitol-1-/sugar-/sorbitol-6-phosphatase
MTRLRLTARAILLDLDGTLVDSRASIERGWARWCAEFGVDLQSVLRIMPGRTAESVFAEVAPQLVNHELAEQGRRLMGWQERDSGDVVALPGVAEMLAGLPDSGWAVVTSGNPPLARARLTAAGLPIPPVLISCEDVANGKPDPAGYLLAAARLGVEPAGCLVVEDADSGIAAGRAAGMPVLAVGPTVPPAGQAAATWWVLALDQVTLRVS